MASKRALENILGHKKWEGAICEISPPPLQVRGSGPPNPPAPPAPLAVHTGDIATVC